MPNESHEYEIVLITLLAENCFIVTISRTIEQNLTQFYSYYFKYLGCCFVQLSSSCAAQSVCGAQLYS